MAEGKKYRSAAAKVDRSKRYSLEDACKLLPQTTVAKFDERGEPTLSYEDVDTSLIPPRPRLYGLVGAEVIEEVWKERASKHAANGTPAKTGAAVGAAH